jgi:hypothetical protein
MRKSECGSRKYSTAEFGLRILDLILGIQLFTYTTDNGRPATGGERCGQVYFFLLRYVLFKS